MVSFFVLEHCDIMISFTLVCLPEFVKLILLPQPFSPSHDVTLCLDIIIIPGLGIASGWYYFLEWCYLIKSMFNCSVKWIYSTWQWLWFKYFVSVEMLWEIHHCYGSNWSCFWYCWFCFLVCLCWYPCKLVSGLIWILPLCIAET